MHRMRTFLFCAFALWGFPCLAQPAYELVEEDGIYVEVFDSTATSRLGETHLTALFHPKYGFVKLDYTNIDGSRTVLELTEWSLAEE